MPTDEPTSIQIFSRLGNGEFFEAALDRQYQYKFKKRRIKLNNRDARGAAFEESMHEVSQMIYRALCDGELRAYSSINETQASLIAARYWQSFGTNESLIDSFIGDELIIEGESRFIFFDQDSAFTWLNQRFPELEVNPLTPESGAAEAIADVIFMYTPKGQRTSVGKKHRPRIIKEIEKDFGERTVAKVKNASDATWYEGLKLARQRSAGGP